MNEPPTDLDRTERRSWRKLVKTLRDRGVDVAGRLDVLADFLRVSSRAERMQAEEAAAEGIERRQLGRALTSLMVEKRRLHTQMFAGATKIAPPVVPSKQAHGLVLPEESEADKAWRAYFHGESQRSHDELQAAYGHPSWEALCYKDMAEKKEADEAIHKNRRWARDENDGERRR